MTGSFGFAKNQARRTKYPFALGAIQAFKQAYGGQEPSRLVIRTSGVIDIA